MMYDSGGRRSSVISQKRRSVLLTQISENNNSSGQKRAKRNTAVAESIPAFKHEDETDEDAVMLVLQKTTSIRTLYSDYERVEALLNAEDGFNSRLFDLFAVTDLIGREKTLPLLSVHLFLQHNLIKHVNEQKLSRFLTEVSTTYRQDVSYHNDLHGIDVAQMAHLFLVQGGLTQLLELNEVDILAYFTAAICHDLGHDGYTNGYHVNSVSSRAIAHNDVSVQESYHVAETFKILSKSEANFLDGVRPQVFKHIRKRMIGCILATDMAKHASDLASLK
jgi:hypothetical protein